jgi:hypothetical protein
MGAANDPLTDSIDRRLCAALVTKGRRGAVVEYLLQCERNWPLGRRAARHWRTDIERKKSADFDRWRVGPRDSFRIGLETIRHIRQR